MTPTQKKRSPWLKRILILALIGVIATLAIIWYVFTMKYDDTKDVKADFTVNALPFISEFKTNEAAANKKYTEKIVIVNGNISALEAADSTVNVKMIDSATGSYAIFAFQQQDLASSKALKEGDQVSIKGSCSGGTFSSILEVESISFKRCTLVNNSKQ